MDNQIIPSLMMPLNLELFIGDMRKNLSQCNHCVNG